MDTWNRLTELRGKWVGGPEEISQRTQKYTCIAYGHGQQCGEGWGRWGLGGGGQRQENGDIYHSVNRRNLIILQTASLLACWQSLLVLNSNGRAKARVARAWGGQRLGDQHLDGQRLESEFFVLRNVKVDIHGAILKQHKSSHFRETALHILLLEPLHCQAGPDLWTVPNLHCLTNNCL